MHLPNEGNLFTAKPEPLSDLLNGIHRHKTALPDFQRPWVWEPQMIRDLLISVAYRYPAGSLLTMPVTTTGFALRAFEGSGDTLSSQPTLMVLDGQQRLTSLYQALYRKDGVRIKDRIFYFYLDVSDLLSDPDDIDVGDPYFDQALFFVQERNGKRVRYDRLTPLYEITTRDQELTHSALPISCIFDPDGDLAEWRQAYLLRQAGDDMKTYLELDKRWNRLVKPWLDRIRSYPFPVVELRPDMPLSAICHIFEKVNSTGVPLDVFDLCTAILWAQGFKLNQEWEKTRAQLQPLMRMQPLSGTYFLQGIALLDSLDRKATDPKVSVSCRKQDLMNLKAAVVKHWWSVLVEGYKEAAKFMTNEGVLSERILPYSTLIMPLATIFALLKQQHGPAYIGALWPKVAQWYWCSVFSQRYGSQVETLGALDFEQVVRWVEGGAPPDIVRTFYFRADVLQETTSLRSALYKGVLCLLARNGAKDFGGGGRLSTDLFYDSRQDHHHIFPKAALKRQGITDKRIDSVVNKTLINAAVNRSIGGRSPSDYIQTLRERLGVGTLDDIFTSHLIDTAVLSQNNWDAFLRARRDLLSQLIAEVCGGTMQPFSDAGLVIEEADEEEIIA